MSDLVQDLQRAYWTRNQLHALIVELTARCPCRCRHCYIVHEALPDELTTGDVCHILDQARNEGVFHLLLTGGEPLARRDLPAILAHARRHRFFVTVLTSGLTLDDNAADELARHKVFAVELSLLGATSAVNDDMMQVDGALERIKEAVRRVRRRGLRVTLKATMLRANAGELAAMAALARELDCGFSASPVVVPRRSGDREPQRLALDEDDLAALDPALLGAGLIPGEEVRGGALLVCKAGRSVAGVSPQGEVYPCIMWPRSVGNLRERSLRDIWHDHPDPYLQELRALTADDMPACAGCDLRAWCRRCPGLVWQETGDPRGAAPSLCAGARGHRRAGQSR
ncbi:MAG: radical SAM protein [Candidatus Krumholzibacteria bacterium]|nr:radical SAM protein [Candidatus Krumholzibacteria bacterium]